MGLIAVHCGAGNYSTKNESKYKKLCKEACGKADKILKQSGSALEACEAALKVLENSGLTNAGFGSNLTLTGKVECEAAIMDGTNCNFGACASLKLIKNPISLAKIICNNQSVPLSGQRVQPQLLVGPGAEFYAKRNKVPLLSKNKLLVSEKQQKYYKKKKVLFINDTIGAVCIDMQGRIAAGASSGGISWKSPGRIGHCAVYGSGIWAERKDNNYVAVCTSGCGEYLVRTQLAKNLSHCLFSSEQIPEATDHYLQENFFNSPYLSNVKEKLVGILVLHKSSASQFGELVWAHSSAGMAIGWSHFRDDDDDLSTSSNIKAVVSRLHDNSFIGKKIVINGLSF